ncbi:MULTISPECIES: ABC transporter permease [unclassified Fusibacter]|uniref:ABC transporter permease n=1 Tax=unclassified Fusibacter TaxID=2624464 RepID=UPI0019D6EB0A|nr:MULTISPECIES: ABC transporter permease [unclassified Fusibacter]MCK8060222.1 ABC transporter permease [Fusibacter sp. A2]
MVGNIFGAIAAYKKGVYDKIIFPTALFVSSVPFFVLSILLLYGLAVVGGWFPVGGPYDRTMIPDGSWLFYMSLLKHHFLPFLSIAIVMLGGQGIGMREMALYELSSDYVKYSKMLGIRESKIVRYVFKNAALPQITGLAISLGTMIAGALITEIVFNYPGLGLQMFKAIRGLDYPMISACTLLITITVLAANFIVDILYGFLDPRIKANQMEES